MKIKYFVVDAFTDEVFKGNPAGVCIIETEEYPPAETMQNIAAENRLSETAFVKRRSDGSYDIRYFTPNSEVELCGHATMGTTYVLSRFIDPEADVFEFHAPEDELSARKIEGGRFALDFPAWYPEEVELTEEISKALNGLKPVALMGLDDLAAVLETEEDVKNFVPDQEAIGALKYRGMLITAKGSDSDFVDRSFFPNLAIPEDPVCGSAKCTLAPLWNKLTGKTEFKGYQLSERTGTVYCKLIGDRVEISGNAALYLQGEIDV